MEFIILDLEATCWQGNAMNRRQEIIEFGAYRINGYGEWLNHFHTYVRPTDHPRLSAYCLELTGIEQGKVDNASLFPEAFDTFLNWAEESSQAPVLCTWGHQDVPLIRAECERHDLTHDHFHSAIDLKSQFTRMHRLSRPVGLLKALDMMDIPFEGEPHCALDDAFNTTKLFIRHMDSWQY